MKSKDETIQKLTNDLSQLKNTFLKSENNDSSNIETILYHQGHEFDGIIKQLTLKARGNLHDKGIIEVTSNSINSNNHPKNLLTSDSKYYSAKNGVKNFWVLFNFKKFEIEISSYSIRSFDFPVGHIKNWVLEISNDGENFEEIDEHSNCEDLNQLLVTKTFSVKKNHFSRFVRFRHIGEFWSYKLQYFPGFNRIEFFGFLKAVQ